MDFSALMLSVEATRHHARSALPDAEVRPDRDRWRRVAAAARRLIRLRAAARGGFGGVLRDYSP